MLASEVISTARKGLFMVEGPRLRTRTRPEDAATFSRYSTILSQRASFLSVPIRKPKNSSGVGTAAETENKVRNEARLTLASERVMGHMIPCHPGRAAVTAA